MLRGFFGKKPEGIAYTYFAFILAFRSVTITGFRVNGNGSARAVRSELHIAAAKELQHQLGHKRYDTVWSLMHRLRNTMGNRDDLYVLEDMIEFDEAYFSKASPDGVKLKRGKGSQRKQNVAVMAESPIA